MSPSIADYNWFQPDAYCMTYVRDVTPTGFLSRLRAVGLGELHGLNALESRYWEGPDREHWNGSDEPWPFIGATSVPGTDAPWTLVMEVNGFLGTLDDVMTPASAGTRIVSHYVNIKALAAFNWWEDGELRTSFEWPRERSGSTPDALVETMIRLGFDLGPRGESPGIPGKMALAEELTGVRVTPDLLADATYITGIVNDPPSIPRPRMDPAAVRAALEKQGWFESTRIRSHTASEPCVGNSSAIDGAPAPHATHRPGSHRPGTSSPAR
ncbi:DUF6461 domain-containing protein [Streptomyces sp. NPDC050617]|uniref:DUF6461 domain-containing protein n=1 Tax=Streptomyces sp. NPDC050617 TaxID=3154628 RepID=UPI00342E01D5